MSGRSESESRSRRIAVIHRLVLGYGPSSCASTIIGCGSQHYHSIDHSQKLHYSTAVPVDLNIQTHYCRLSVRPSDI